MQKLRKVLVDTCVLLDDPDVLVRIRNKGGLPFLTSTVLDELDFNKSGNSAASRNARIIFREFNKENSRKISNLPTGEPLIKEDLATEFSFKLGPVFLITREEFKTKTNNDSKIIELARDYDLILVTRDNGMKVRAEAVGVKAFLWTGPDESPHPKRTSDDKNSGNHSPKIKPFSIASYPISEPDIPVAVTSLPRSGDTVLLQSGASIRLGKEINSGGEGTIYETDDKTKVCKIYHANRLTKLKKKKIELMVSRQISRRGICWPSEVINNKEGQFVGYLMPMAKGKTMQSTMFVKPKLEKTFPNWSRLDLVNIAGCLTNHVAFLHNLNIIIGDINPQNFLVTEDSTELWMVDVDSFQIEGFPCPVGTVNFTPAEIQNKNYSEFLRTIDHELFAVATMVFMILLPGKPPYSQQGGGSPSENIKLKNFPYFFYKEAGASAPDVSGKDAPVGPWQYIWSNLPVPIRRAFFNTFREDKRTSVKEWTSLLISYRDKLEQRFFSNDLFPATFPIRDPVKVSCGKCSASFTASQRYVEKLSANGKQPWCSDCTNRFRMERLARQSRNSIIEEVKKPAVVGKNPPGTSSGNHYTTSSPRKAASPIRMPNPTPIRSTITPNNKNQSSTLGGLVASIFKALFK